MNQTFLKMIIERYLGSFIRHGIMALGVWRQAHGGSDIDGDAQSKLFDEALNWICILLPVIWSVLKSHVSAKKIELAEAIIFKMSSLGAFAQQASPSGTGQKPNPLPSSTSVTMLAVVLSASLIGCVHLVSSFDQNSLDAAISLKTEALGLMAHGGEPFKNYADRVNVLRSKLTAELAYENGKGTPNITTRKQWELLISHDHLLGKFLDYWESGNPISPLYIKGEIEMVDNTFDQIIGLEGGKKTNE